MTNTELIKLLVRGGNTAHFSRYFDGQLWYSVSHPVEYDGTPSDIETGAWKVLEFPVPISDIGTATFHETEKALLLMRYIRKHLEMLDKAKVNGE